MKQSIIVIMMFVLGCIIGDIYTPNWDLHNVSMMILYALMFQVGLSVGCSPNLKAILRNFKPKMLLLPLATISGTLLFSAIISVALVQWRVTDCMAVGSGMGYYSLSSILITQLQSAHPWPASSSGAGHHCTVGQHLSRNDSSHLRPAHSQNIRAACHSDCCGCYLGRRMSACHNPHVWQGYGANSPLPRHAD